MAPDPGVPGVALNVEGVGLPSGFLSVSDGLPADEDARPEADVDPRAGSDAAPAVDVPPASGGTVFGGGAVTPPGVGLPVVTPGFPLGDVVLAPVDELLVFAGAHGSAAGGLGVGAGIIGGMLAGLPVGVGWPGAVVDGVCPAVVGGGA